MGNVGQLTADLLISTLQLEKQGYLYDDSLLPMVGNNPFSSTDVKCEIATSVEGLVKFPLLNKILKVCMFKWITLSHFIII